jgi:hypothetical protein
MEHPRIDDEQIIDRYLAAQLGPEDEALFEEHLFACAGCLEQVQWGEELRRGLRAVAAEEAARASVAVGLMAWLRGRRPGQLAGLAGLALALVLLPALLLWQQGELSRLRQAGGQVATGSAGFVGPVSDFLVVSLGVVRDAGDAVEIRPEPGKEAVLLSLELPVATFPRYRATLRNTAGKVLWQGEDLEPSLYDTLLVALPSSYLAPGGYRITVEGLSAAGAEPVGEIRFRIFPDE